MITVHANSTFRIHLNTDVLADQIAAENEAFREILDRYDNNDTELAGQVVQSLKVLFNEMFSNELGKRVEFV